MAQQHKTDPFKFSKSRVRSKNVRVSALILLQSLIKLEMEGVSHKSAWVTWTHPSNLLLDDVSYQELTLSEVGRNTAKLDYSKSETVFTTKIEDSRDTAFNLHGLSPNTVYKVEIICMIKDMIEQVFKKD